MTQLSRGAELLRSIYDCGATSGHVARILNVSEATVSRWGSGERRPCEYNLQRLQRLKEDLLAWDMPTAQREAS